MKKALWIIVWCSYVFSLQGQVELVQIPEDFLGNEPYEFLGEEKSLSLSASVYYFDDPQNQYDAKQILQPEIQQLFRRMDHASPTFSATISSCSRSMISVRSK